MKTKIVILGMALVATAFYGGYRFGRSTLPVTIVRSEGREIISSSQANATDSTSITHTGSTHSSGYSVEAFMMIGYELEKIMESIVGPDTYLYHGYVLPDPGGFTLVVHHDNLTTRLTDDQHQQLLERVRESLISLTEKFEKERQ